MGCIPSSLEQLQLAGDLLDLVVQRLVLVLADVVVPRGALLSVVHIAVLSGIVT